MKTKTRMDEVLEGTQALREWMASLSPSRLEAIATDWARREALPTESEMVSMTDEERERAADEWFIVEQAASMVDGISPSREQMDRILNGR